LLGRLEGIPKLKGVRFDSFAIEYLELCKKNNTQKHYATKKYVILKSIVPYFENKVLLNIQATDVEAYISKRQQEGVSQKTLLNEYTLLKHMLNQAIKWDYLRVNPCIKVVRPKVVLPLPQVLTKDQIKQVLEFIDKNEEYYRCKYLVRMLFYTGCRRSEISNMRWSDVDLDQNTITVQAHDGWHPKDYEARTIGINNTLRSTLLEFRKWQRSLGVYGKYLFPREIYGLDDNLTGFMHNLMKAAGIEVDQPMHVWRHSFAYHMIRGGTKPAYLQQLMGHQDIRTTMAYLRLTQTDISQQTECLPDF